MAIARTIPAGFCLGVLLLAAGCVKPPPQLDVGALPEVTLEQARGGGYVGRRVRWGGELVTTKPGQEQTCFEVVHRPLDGRARPRETDESSGRFMTCLPGFYDPAIYAPGRDVTIVGTVDEPVTGRIGEHDYSYASLDGEEIYLWPKRERRQRAYYTPDPWLYYYGPYSPYYPPGYPWGPYYWPHRPWYW